MKIFGKFRNMALALVAVVGLGAGGVALADPCPSSGTYDQLVTAGTCTIGDKTFTGFTFGGVSIPSSDVTFSAVNGVGGFWGFTFTFNLTVTAGGSEDFGITYHVSCTDGSACIDSVHATMTGSERGTDAFATVSETYQPIGGLTTHFDLTPGSPTYDASIAPTSSLYITKDINVTCGPASPCLATISILTNTVDQVTVPEPGTLALLAAGLLGLGWVGRRRQDR